MVRADALEDALAGGFSAASLDGVGVNRDGLMGKSMSPRNIARI
ncbi:hypothetical protein [Paracoccus sp. M683]|nr:hypothetical protein [Paracoccus sp. M683]